jgi:signal transduction histidine kinase
MKPQGVLPQIARPQVEERVSSVVDDLDATIKDIRTAIFELQAREDKERHGLRARVMEVLEQMTGPLELSLSVRLDDQMDSEVPDDIGEDMLHVLREALSNAARHGKATQVEVTVAVGPELRLLVRDNGIGIGETNHRSGLANLARRAGQYGGHAHSCPSRGRRNRTGLAGVAQSGQAVIGTLLRPSFSSY